MKHEAGVIVIASRGDGRILFARRTYAFLDYVLPGGGIDHGEDPFDAAVREVKEETGYLLDPQSLRHLGTCIIPGRNEITFVIAGSTTGRIEEFHSEEISTFGFFGSIDIPTPITRAHYSCAMRYFDGTLQEGSIETIAMDEFELIERAGTEPIGQQIGDGNAVKPPGDERTP